MSKPGADPSSGISLEDVLRLTKRHPACRRREAQPGSCTERENLCCGLIPKGAKNVVIAKDFLKYLIQPKVCNEYLKTGLGRSTPCMPSIVKTDPWWFADPHRKPYTTQVLLEPTLPQYWVFNPAYAQVQTEHVWSQGWMDIIQNGMTPEAAADKAFKRIEEIFAKYPIEQA